MFEQILVQVRSQNPALIIGFVLIVTATIIVVNKGAYQIAGASIVCMIFPALKKIY